VLCFPANLKARAGNRREKWQCIGPLALAICFCIEDARTDPRPPLRARWSPRNLQRANQHLQRPPGTGPGDAWRNTSSPGCGSCPGCRRQLSRIGERLLKTLPPTGIRYSFRIYDSARSMRFGNGGELCQPEVDRRREERKMSWRRSGPRDGHLSTHQTAIDDDAPFKARLGITEWRPRRRLCQSPHAPEQAPKASEEEHETKGELVADHVAIYACCRPATTPEVFQHFSTRYR